MDLTQQHLTGQAYLAAVTDLLQRIRLEDALAGLYEAADLQWWWREEQAAIPERQRFWCDSHGRAVACLLQFDAGKEWNHDFLRLPSAQPMVDPLLIPEAIARISHLDRTSVMTVRDDDRPLQDALEAAGFVADAGAMVQTELVQDPPRTQLAQGFHLTSRVEDERPHHLIRRNGADVALRLHECSLYRPELDLCVRDAAGNVAAYVLFWMDDVTKVGLIEPVRTEKEFQRMGLASHIIAEGIARLRALGAQSIRVTYSAHNEAAANLYHRLGFADRFKCFDYRREPSGSA